MESEVFERIREYLADQLDVEPEKITPDSADEEIANFHTVGDVVSYLEDRL